MIELINVSKYFITDFGRHYVFRDVNLVLPLDKSVAVLGPNGAGKSTFLRLLGGADQPSTGTIVKTGRISPPMGLTPSLQPSLNGVENARFAGRIYGMERDEINEMIEYVKNLANIGKFFYMPVATYSAGMRQRVAFAINMSMNFDYYLFDEIGAGGDREFRKVAKQMVRDRLKSSKFIMTSHNTGELLEICDSGIVIKDGELRFFENVNDAVRFYGEDPEEELRRERDGADGESERPRRRKRKKDKGPAPGDEAVAAAAAPVETTVGAGLADGLPPPLPPPQSKAERRAARKAEADARRRAKAEERAAMSAEAEAERQARKAARAAASAERKARIAAARAAKLANPPKPRRGKKNALPAGAAGQQAGVAAAVPAAGALPVDGAAPVSASLPGKSADAAAREARRAAKREQRLALRRENRAAEKENAAADSSAGQPAPATDAPAASPLPADPDREARRAAKRQLRLEQRAAAKAAVPSSVAVAALPAPEDSQPADDDAGKSAAREALREQRKAERREARRAAAKAQRVAERQNRRAAGAPSPEGAPATPDNRRKRSGAADS